MPKIYRYLSAGLMVLFLGSVASITWMTEVDRRMQQRAPSMLPAAVASPIDVAFADTLQAGETISELVQRAELAETEADVLLEALQRYQDLRKMKPGFAISYRRSVENSALRRMEVRLDADRMLSLTAEGDGWSEQVEEIPVFADTVVLSGRVDSSLYQALINNRNSGIPLEERERIADVLADRIFAWQVDFSRDLRKGDRFRILYERLVRPDGTAKASRVLTVQFNINHRDYEAYAFVDGSVEDYFDGDGESLKRAFLRAPLEYRRISSAFTRSRFHPVLRVNRAHHGIDYAAGAGTPVRAVGDGLIRRASGGGSYGNLVEIRHARGYSSRYAHLRGFADGIRPGVRVKQGDIIGYVGSTGLATGPHLHYEFHSNGQPVDPNSVPDLSGDPVPSSYKTQFFERVQEYVSALDLMTPQVLADRTRSDGLTASD